MTERIRFSAQDTDSLSQAVKKAAATLERGGVILYPTDTIYGLGADATNTEAVSKVNQIKGRGQEKRMIIIASNISMVERFAALRPTERKLAEKFWPGPLTIELEHSRELPDILTGGIRRGGFRIPNHTFCREVVSTFGKPITSTSANISGQPPAAMVDEILKTFGDNARDIDLVIEEADRIITDPTPSTLVKIEGDRVAILREGAIPRQAIEAVQQ